MSNYFEENYENVILKKNKETSIGLRNSQIGALHAIGAFYSLHEKEPSIIVMPTGSGKTAVLMLAPYLIEAQKVLIVTPNAMVRTQIYDDYSNLKTLKKANVFSDSIIPPKVYELENLYSNELSNDIREADVIVSTHICAKSLTDSIEMSALFDFILIDEAHHVPAKTWSEILSNLTHCKKLLFTATPFRLDKKEIKGKLIYSYPLSKAYEDKIFGEIEYIAVNEKQGLSNEILLAKKAEEIYLHDKISSFEHYLMIRTNTKAHAQELEKIYSEETKLNVVRIDSSMSYKKIQDCLANLKSGKLDGIICIDMLGEGFDFPNLKIAIIHSPHKSLASTLQFIGRFSRTNATNIGSAKFVAINNDELIIENNKLYAADTIWNKIIINMSENRFEKEQKLKEFVDNFKPIDNNIYEKIDISLYNIRPNAHAKVFYIEDFYIDGKFPEICKVANNYFINEDNNIIIGIGVEEEKPKWISSNDLNNKNLTLYIVHFQPETNLMFIYSSSKTEMLYNAIADEFCSSFSIIPRFKMNRVLGQLSDFEIFNSGFQSRYSETGETYRISTGSNVANNIDASTGRLYSAGHVFCTAKKAEIEITIGYSSAGKIWSSSYLSLFDYIKWCDENGKKINNNNIRVRTNTKLDSLPTSEELKKIPENIFLADFNERIYSTPPQIIKINNYDNLLLTSFDLIFSSVKNDKIYFSLNYNDFECKLSFDITENYKVESNSLTVIDGSKTFSINEYFNTYPLTFKTTDDNTIIGNEILKTNTKEIVFDSTCITDIDWIKYNTDVTIEFGQSKDNNKISLHDAIQKILSTEHNFEYIIYDHSSGEISDFIAFNIDDSNITVSLFHVKAKKSSGYNSSATELYEVCGQSVKSAMWLKDKKTLLNKMIDRTKSKHCIFVKGNFSNLKTELKSSKLFRAKVIAVQPAICKTEPFQDKIKNVISASDEYLNNIGHIDRLIIWGSKI